MPEFWILRFQEIQQELSRPQIKLRTSFRVSKLSGVRSKHKNRFADVKLSSSRLNECVAKGASRSLSDNMSEKLIKYSEEFKKRLQESSEIIKSTYIENILTSKLTDFCESFMQNFQKYRTFLQEIS